jgi:hypothetical protein
MPKCNLFLTPTGRLNADGRRLCRLAAEFRSRRKQLAAEYRLLGYDDFSILFIFREADDRRRLIQQANRRRKRRRHRPAPPGEDLPFGIPRSAVNAAIRWSEAGARGRGTSRQFDDQIGRQRPPSAGAPW